MRLFILMCLVSFASACVAEPDAPLGPNRAPTLGKADGWGVHSLDQVRTFAFQADQFSLIHGDDPSGTEVLLDPTAPAYGWLWTGWQWQYLGLIDEPTYVAVSSPAWIALYPPGQDIDVRTAYIGPPHLKIQRVFNDTLDGQTFASAGATPGSRLYALVNGRSLNAASEIEVTFTHTASSTVELHQPQTLEARFVDLPGLAADGDQRAVEFFLPTNARIGFGEIEIKVAGFVAGSIPVDVASPDTIEVRSVLAVEVQGHVAELAPDQELSVIGGHNALPVGAIITDGMTDEVVHTVKHQNTFLMFAFDPTALFEQPEAMWFIASYEFGIQRIEGGGGWPVIETVVESETEETTRLIVDFGVHGVLYNQFFDIGTKGLQFSTLSFDPALIAKINKGKQVSGHATAPDGTPVTDANPPCPNYRKVGVIVRLDDNTATTRVKKTGESKVIPNFDDVIKKQVQLLYGMGFDDVKFVNPEDIVKIDSKGRASVSFGSTFSSTVSRAKGLGPILAKITAAMKSIKNCCGEVVVFFNGHQKQLRRLKFRYRQKGKVVVKGNIDTGILIEAVTNVFVNASRTCIPTTVLFHSCRSGDFGSEDFGQATNAHKKLVVLSSSSKSQLTRGVLKQGKPPEFLFLEALDECMLLREDAANPTKITGLATFKQAWQCIVTRTKERAAAANIKKGQTPQRKQHSSLD